MTPEMKQRLLEYANEEIERHSTELNYTGGNNVVVSDRLVTLPYPSEPGQEVKEETWRLALIGTWTRLSNFLPTLTSDLLVLGTIPRNTGFFVINSGFPQTVSKNSSSGDYIHYRWSMATRIYEPSEESIPSPGFDPDSFGQPYGGTIRFTMEQRGPGNPGTTYSLTDVVVPASGTTFLATPAVDDVSISVFPVLNSFERVR